MASDIIQRHATAKLNLCLAVIGQRSDGFHAIESWVRQVEWFDQISFRPGDEFSLDIPDAPAGVPVGRDNLVWRAAEALAAAAGIAPCAAVTLHKAIPPEAGLGGGSSDAAQTLLGLNELWGLNWPDERLHPIAAALGSDVPLFLSPNPSIIRGRGDVIEQVSPEWEGFAVIAIPPFGVSTAKVYGAWQATRADGAHLSRPWEEGRASGESVMPLLFNDLEPAALAVVPRLSVFHKALDGLDAKPVRLTGSGSACFTLFDSAADAKLWVTSAVSRVGRDVTFKIARFSPARPEDSTSQKTLHGTHGR